MEYPKTENLYARDEVTHKLRLGEFKRLDFSQVDCWRVTEKIDGTNIRLVLQAGAFEVRGRTDAASLPPNFEEEALGQAGADTMAAALAAIDPAGVAITMIVFGEGYGPGIQKGGGGYAERKSLRIFDVLTYKEGCYSPLWRTWDDVVTVATILGLQTVPTLLIGAPTETIVELVRSDLYSQVAARDLDPLIDDLWSLRKMEGVVARTDPYLYDYRGHRVLWKLKKHDLP